MDFKHIVKEAVEKSGGKASLIMGKDGISVSHYVREGDSFDIERVGTEYNRVIEELKGVTESLNFGDIEEITLVTKDHRIMIKSLDKDYFLALVIDTDVYPGKASFVLRKTASRANREL